MIQIILVAALLGVSYAMPQQRALGAGAAAENVAGNPFTRILSYESYQDGANFGHQLFQEDGTTSGQKQGPDGLLYGFYSYVQPDNNRVKVYWRAGQGIGYEVLGVEGLVKENLGNLQATISASTPPPAPARLPVQQNTFIPPAPTPPPPTQSPIPQPAPRAPARLIPNNPIPVVPITTTTEFPPHRFDYPATLNLERTANGFFSSLTATR
ncbi:pupal cuticle protein [Hyalella azteca]|uniref:Fibronectin-binding protein A n=1 Tax=Hyalella azteca TaxID=294128 RepID=A0A6A0H150_HYAAZ|nr:fibronectin-binding protein A [Hyalella azteca]KAA0195342.1 pupal cuticle protein [Hyalella azteca]